MQMLEPILTFLPVLAMFLGALASLSIDFKKRGSNLLLLLLPVLSLALAIAQFLDPGIQSAPANLVISKNNAFMVAACMAITFIILVNGFGDFSDKNAERFYHVLLFLIAGTVCGLLYADNLFILGTFILATEVFISILKFIYPSIDKKMFNALIATFTTGFISLMIGCLMIYNVTGNAQYLYLSSFGAPTVPPIAPVPPLALFFLYAGFLIVFAAFPMSMLVHFGLHLKSHVSVKVFNLFFTSALYWKFLQVHDALNLTGIAFDATSFVLGMGNMVAGIAAISRELIGRKQRRIEMVVMASYMIDFGIMLALFGLMGEAGMAGYEIQQAIMLQVIVTLATKVLFILSVKNITNVFHSDVIEDMEGLRLRRPVTLAGYVMGTAGTVYLGIFILDAVYKVIAEAPSSITGQVLFWGILVTILFTSTWIAVTIAWIFGGKDLPASVQNTQPRGLRKDEATIALLIAFNAVVVLLLWLLPSAAFLEAMMPGM
jgi:formate hydrogenlyase subunit 3/multisubunit Na+/H+ antiporter MnhD subunit